MASAMLTPQEVGDILKVHSSFVYRLARQGVLIPVRVGRYVRFTEETVDSYISQNTSKAS